MRAVIAALLANLGIRLLAVLTSEPELDAAGPPEPDAATDRGPSRHRVARVVGAFGRLMITNPDLPRRFKENAPLNEMFADAPLYGGIGPHGYIDYPSLPA